MASITDCVAEGLKYPFRDIKKLLGFGVLFALLSAVSTYIGIKSFDIFRMTVHIADAANTTVSHIPFSQLPAGDIYLVAGLAVASFVIALFIMGYEYDVLRFSIDKKEDLPGFDAISAMFVKGIKYFLVSVAYNLIPAVVLVAGISLCGESSILPIIGIISMVLFIIAYLLLVIALNNMVAHDDFKKAFDFRQITGNISNLGWGKYIGTIIFTVIVMTIISVAVGFVLSFITVLFAATVNNQAVVISFVLAIIEGLFIDSYMAVFLNRVFGSIYRESIK